MRMRRNLIENRVETETHSQRARVLGYKVAIAPIVNEYKGLREGASESLLTASPGWCVE